MKVVNGVSKSEWDNGAYELKIYDSNADAMMKSLFRVTSSCHV